MKLDEFEMLIGSREHPVVLLEGRREVAEQDRAQLIALAVTLALRFPKSIFRSGNAKGADAAFAEGVCQVDPGRLQLVLPRRSMGKDRRHPYARSYSLEQIPAIREAQIVLHSKTASPRNAGLFEQASRPNRTGRLAAKGSYLLRDTLKVLGDESLGLAPATAGIFYIDPADPMAGGTGHTIRVCQQHQVPVVTQLQWRHWLRS